jgi:signal transduction histidine kinase/putative methionine-R-sulfoxide reductase with GAF domain
MVRSREPEKAMRAMVREISILLNADRTTIYALDSRTKMLTGIAVQDEASVSVGVPVGEGIAGLVASRGRALNLKDAYQHPRFDPKYDKLTGYRTRSMLCVPMRNPRRQISGVVQVLNKRDRDYFSLEDELLLTALASQAAITLDALQLQLQLNVSNTELQDTSRQLVQRVTELEFLVDNERQMAEAQSEHELCDVVLRLACRVADCEYAAAFLHDENGNGPIYARGAAVEGALASYAHGEVGEGLMGKAANRTRVFTYRPETEPDAPRRLGGKDTPEVRDLVVAPLIDGDRHLGAVALVNRKGVEKRADAEDERFAVLLAGQMARAITRQVERRSAQQRDRLMAIGSMLSGVLHDLKGPMSIISGYTQLMAEEQDGAERGRMAATIRRKVGEFNDMTREVMEFVLGKSTVLVRKVYLDKFIEAVREQIEFEFSGRGVAFVVNDLTRGVGHFDEPKMMRVVTNIARNARQAMGESGTFTWTLRDVPPADGLSGGLRFELADDGPGIPAGMRRRLFEAFATEGKHGGTGLGLAIVRRIVDDHAGSICFESTTGQGTTFYIELPGRPHA